MPHRLTELHNIMPLTNIPTVLDVGILCYEQALHLKHADISMQAIQDRRDKIQVPSGLKLHKYANLYFHARNPMMYKRQDEVDSLCVLRISTKVLKIDGTVITDQNASSKYASFFSPREIEYLNFDRIYARDWRHPEDKVAFWQHRSQKCAEVLVPKVVPPHLITGAFVISTEVQTALRNLRFSRPIEIEPDLFFRQIS